MNAWSRSCGPGQIARRDAPGDHGSGGNAGEYAGGRGQLAAAARKPARQSFERRTSGSGGIVAFQPLEHVEVFALDDRPGVMLREVVAAVASQARMEWPVGFERVQRFGEFS